MSEPLTKIDSAVQGLSSSPPKEKSHKRASSSVPGVYNINDLGMFATALTDTFTALRCTAPPPPPTPLHPLHPRHGIIANQTLSLQQKRRALSSKSPLRRKKLDGTFCCSLLTQPACHGPSHVFGSMTPVGGGSLCPTKGLSCIRLSTAPYTLSAATPSLPER